MIQRSVADKAAVQGVIFDVDGTLLDSMSVWDHVGEWYLQKQGRTAEEGLAKKLFAMSLPESAIYLKETYGLPQTPEEIIQGIDEVIRWFYEKEVLPKNGAVEILTWLRERAVPVMIATSGDRELVEAAFERLGMRSLTDKIFTCTEMGKGKSEPDIFLAAAACMGLPPEEVWVVEDTLYALRTAARAGFRTVGVYDAASRMQTAEIQRTADLYAEGLAELRTAWEQMDMGMDQTEEGMLKSEEKRK